MFRFCPRCGAPLVVKPVQGRERAACDACGFVVYENPVPGVAVVLVEDGRVLLARRRSSIYNGMWCIPCGYV